MSRFSALPVVTSAIIVHICVSVDHFFLSSHTHTSCTYQLSVACQSTCNTAAGQQNNNTRFQK